MAGIVFTLAILVVVALVIGSFRVPEKPTRAGMRIVAAIVLVIGFVLSSVTYVPSNKVGVVYKNWLGKSLKAGKIIAVDGEMGPQADILRSGLHFGYWPYIYTVKTVTLTDVASDEVGIIETSDGVAMGDGQLFAAEWPRENFQQMLDARYFLTTGQGRKGKQVSVLTPGRYALNTELYRVRMVKQTEILQGEVGVIKANFGTPPTDTVRADTAEQVTPEQLATVPIDNRVEFAKPGEMGIRREVLAPGKYPINTDAFTVVEIYSTQMVSHYTAAHAGSGPLPSGSSATPVAEEREITVRTADGFTFPVDVRVEYVVEPRFAPIAVAKLGDDEGERFRNALNSAVRAIFRNNAENVRALDYVQQRSHQESQSLTMLKQQMGPFGVRVTAVRIGNVGDEKSLGELLKTQTDRELAKQEQQTFQEQQRAAEQKKQLARTQQESDEEKKLATANYAVKIASEEQKKRIAEAEGEAQAIKIKALAQADAYRQIAEQIGKNNAALVELLKVVGEKNIQITPRVFMAGEQSSQGMGTALMGTMLDQMIGREESATTPPTRK